MLQSNDIERSMRRRLKKSKKGTRTVHRTGEPSQPRGVETRELDYKNARSGRVLLDVSPGSLVPLEHRTYKTQGVPKKLVRTATVMGDEGGEWFETASPKPGMTIINGLSDKVVNVRRVQRRARKSKGGNKGARGVLR